VEIFTCNQQQKDCQRYVHRSITNNCKLSVLRTTIDKYTPRPFLRRYIHVCAERRSQDSSTYHSTSSTTEATVHRFLAQLAELIVCLYVLLLTQADTNHNHCMQKLVILYRDTDNYPRQFPMIIHPWKIPKTNPWTFAADIPQLRITLDIPYKPPKARNSPSNNSLRLFFPVQLPQNASWASEPMGCLLCRSSVS